MRVMLLGSGGMLGTDLACNAPPGVELFRFDRAGLDITDETRVRATVGKTRPDVILNAAAYTAVDRAETEPSTALAVNAQAVGNLAHITADHGACLVHFSSDYVFDGFANVPYREDAPPNPLNVYGRSKLDGERAIATSGSRHLIIRTQWLYGAAGRSFVATMWERARADLPTRVVGDQTGRPTFTKDLASATWRLIELGAHGLIHVANSGIATWHQLAQEVFSLAGARISPASCTTSEYPTPATRPRYSALDTSYADRLLGAPLPNWTDAVHRFMRQHTGK